jgi:hypothetical protein
MIKAGGQIRKTKPTVIAFPCEAKAGLGYSVCRWVYTRAVAVVPELKARLLAIHENTSKRSHHLPVLMIFVQGHSMGRKLCFLTRLPGA